MQKVSHSSLPDLLTEAVLVYIYNLWFLIMVACRKTQFFVLPPRLENAKDNASPEGYNRYEATVKEMTSKKEIPRKTGPLKNKS